MSADATPRPLVVLHVIDSLRLGGAEALVGALVRGLGTAGLTENVVVSTAGDADPGLVAALEAHAREVVLSDAERLADGRLPRDLVRAIRRHAAGVVHSHLSTANITSRLAAAVTRVPHITTLHTMPGPTAEDTRLHAALDGWSGRMSRLLVAPAAEMADAQARMYRIPRERFRVIPNAPAAEPPGPGFDREALRRELLGGAAGPLVLCVARLQAEKGIDELIAATAALAPERPGLRVAVAGGGPEAERLQRLGDESGAGEAIALLGRRSDVGELLAAADAFCLPSRHEGLPLSVLEAMAAGRPVVATAVGGVPGIVDDGVTGVLVPPRDPAALAAGLRRVLDDETLAARLAAAGKALVEREYALGAVVRRYAALYEELARRR